MFAVVTMNGNSEAYILILKLISNRSQHISKLIRVIVFHGCCFSSVFLDTEYCRLLSINDVPVRQMRPGGTDAGHI